MVNAEKLIELIEDFRDEFEQRAKLMGWVDKTPRTVKIPLKVLQQKNALWTEILKRVNDEYGQLPAFLKEHTNIRRDIERTWGAAIPRNQELYIQKAVQKLEKMLYDW